MYSMQEIYMTALKKRSSKTGPTHQVIFSMISSTQHRDSQCFRARTHDLQTPRLSIIFLPILKTPALSSLTL